MSKTAEHTETPWEVSQPYCDSGPVQGEYRVRPVNSQQGHIIAVCRDLALNSNKATAAANATFIVRACNSHDALVEACEGARRYIECLSWCANANHGQPCNCGAAQAEDSLRAALATAKKGT